MNLEETARDEKGTSFPATRKSGTNVHALSGKVTVTTCIYKEIDRYRQVERRSLDVHSMFTDLRSTFIILAQTFTDYNSPEFCTDLRE